MLRIEVKYPTFFNYVQFDMYMYVCYSFWLYVYRRCMFPLFCALNLKQIKAGIWGFEFVQGNFFVLCVINC